MTEVTVDAGHTYRYLRGAMVVMVIMLLSALAIQGFGAPCWQSSISAYYYTPVHTVFVGSLSALGILLIAYRGSKDSEDVLLALAGIMAFVVAMVPTARPEVICGTGLPVDYPLDAGVTNNIWALMIALTCAQGLAHATGIRKGRTPDLSPWGKRARWAFWVSVAVGTGTFLLQRPTFDKYAHYVAATILFIAITLVVFINAYLVDKQVTENKRFYYNIYRIIGWAMVLTLPAVTALHYLLNRLGSWDQTVLVIEVLLIAEFAAFWAFQTVELWDVVDRNRLIPPQTQPDLAPL